jgi:DNA primase
MVSDATPLSRFMIEVSREGCDIDTAEGRALLASQAKPLWMALPEGILKTQLLGEFADLIGIGERELQRLWLAAGQRPTAERSRLAGKGLANPTSAKPRRPVPIRSKPASREDRALQILFSDMKQWSVMASPLQHLLMDLTSAHGRLFTWLDQQWQEHGLQPLAALREGLRGHEHEAALAHLIDSHPLDMDNDVSELQSIMLEMEKAHLSAQIDDLTRRMATDTQAYAAIKLLNARLAGLKKVSQV